MPFEAVERAELHQRIDILGQAIDNVVYDDVLAHIDRAVAERRFFHCITANVDHLMKLRRDPAFRAVYRAADLVVADGVPLVWASRWLGTPLKARVNGTALFERIAAHAARCGYSLFFLGGAEDSAQRAAEVLKARHPRLRIAGIYAPPLGFDRHDARNAQLQRMIAASGADILIVGLGAPKQENWIARHAPGTGVRFAVGVGVSFSLVAGTIARAPRWMQRIGLEWLWRLAMEPRRLWKRYLVDDMPFFWHVARQAVSARRRRGRP
jgi:N-acetylglucosaminyldiphosphoundecaprenol N-acetyl-beta-D-mannosaminyltransferase